MPNTLLKNPVSITGIAASATSGSGAQPVNTLTVEGTSGQATTGAGQTAGAGADVSITAGTGGAAPSGSINGSGGSVTINPGLPGNGGGTSATPGNVLLATAGGKVGVGTSSPGYRFEVAQQSSFPTDNNVAVFTRSTSDAVGAQFNVRKSRGTIASPANIQNGDNCGAFNFAGYSGSWITTASINAAVDGSFSAGQRPPVSLLFYTSTANGSLAERVRIGPSGSVGIGTPAPGHRLEVAQESSFPADNNLAVFSRSTGDAAGAQFNMRKSRGTIAIPTDIQNGDVCGAFNFAGYSSTWITTASINAMVDGAFSSGQRPPVALQFYTSAANGPLSERLRIAPLGNVGIGTTAPSSKLHVDGGMQLGTPTGGDKGTGNINISGDLYKNGTPQLKKIDELTKRIERLEAQLAKRSVTRAAPVRSAKSGKAKKSSKGKR